MGGRHTEFLGFVGLLAVAVASLVVVVVVGLAISAWGLLG